MNDDDHDLIDEDVEKLLSDTSRLRELQYQQQLATELAARGGRLPEQIEAALVTPQVSPPIGGHPVNPGAGWLKAVWATAAALLLASLCEGVMLVNGNRAYAAAQQELTLLSNRLNDLIGQLAALQIDKAIDKSAPHVYVDGRDRLGLRCRIDQRYIREVKWRFGTEGRFKSVFKVEASRSAGNYPNLKEIQVVSDPVVLDGRVEKVYLEFVPWDEIKDTELALLIPETLRRKERDFLMSPNGIIADPRPLDMASDIKITQVVADGDATNTNRYVVTGQIRSLPKGISAYLVVDAIAADDVWITGALQPDAAGNFFVKAFLGNTKNGAELDRQLYGLMVVLTDRKDILKPGNSLKKPVIWDSLGCRNSRMVIKRNDGNDGVISAP